MQKPKFDEPLNRVIQDLVPLIRQLFAGKYAIAVAGSHGKQKYDALSDIDLRAYYDSWIEDEVRCNSVKQEIKDKIQAWHKIGVRIDGYWPRRIPVIESRINSILSGENADPDPCQWTIWGYYLPTDIANNTIIEDPFQILANWKVQLQTYPLKLKDAVIKKTSGQRPILA